MIETNPENIVLFENQRDPPILQKSFINHKASLSGIINEKLSCLGKKTALKYENKSLSFNALNKLSLKFSAILHEQKIQSGCRVVVYLDRSFELFISLISILYRGAIYIPIDGCSIKSRVNYVIEDACPDLIITHKHLVHNLGDSKSRVLLIDYEILEQQKLSSMIATVYSPKDPVYVIYTSGSTGNPKGVEISHEAILNRLLWMIEYLSLSDKEIFCAKTPIGFDVSVWELILPLLLGSTCCIVQSEHHKDIFFLESLIEQNKISICHFVPSMLDIFLEFTKISLSSLKKVVCSGEEFKKTTEKKFFQRFQSALFNFYGPTEAAIDVTAWKCDNNDERNFVPIGYPIWNTNIHILDENLFPVKDGDVGEICISGICLATQYINKEELTNKKFIKVSLNNQQIRVYRTGDIGRKIADNCLQFLGRADEQVKINGCRVELTEIEYYLNSHPAIKSASVLYSKDEEVHKLKAFVVLQKNTSKQAIFFYLKKYLPVLFIPKSIVYLDALPISENGKIDKKSLKNFPISSFALSEFALPTTEMEKKIANIWAEIFHIDQNEIGKNHHFFDDLGGYSLLVPSMINKCINHFGIDSSKLTYHAIVENPTLELFSKKIKSILLSAKKKSPIKTLDWPFVYLNKNIEGTPFFLFHPVGGTVFCYQPLAKYISYNYSIIGVQDPSIDHRKMLFASFKEMAEFYRNMLYQYFPSQNYLLAGLSFGGNLAVEVASYLEKDGLSVDFIGVIDAWANLAEGPEDSIEDWYINQDNRVKYLPVKTNDESWLISTWDRVKFLNQHQISGQVSKITLFKAIDVDYKIKDDPYNYWDTFSRAPIRKFLIPGSHEAIIQEPYVEKLATAINECLAKSKIGVQSQAVIANI